MKNGGFASECRSGTSEARIRAPGARRLPSPNKPCKIPAMLAWALPCGRLKTLTSPDEAQKRIHDQHALHFSHRNPKTETTLFPVGRVGYARILMFGTYVRPKQARQRQKAKHRNRSPKPQALKPIPLGLGLRFPYHPKPCCKPWAISADGSLGNLYPTLPIGPLSSCVLGFIFRIL